MLVYQPLQVLIAIRDYFRKLIDNRITNTNLPDGLQLYSNQTKGALIVYDYENNNAWRVLDSHPSVQPLEDYWLIGESLK